LHGRTDGRLRARGLQQTGSCADGGSSHDQTGPPDQEIAARQVIAVVLQAAQRTRGPVLLR
jgi:hypothetical protein